MPVEYEFVKTGGLVGREPVETQAVKDKQVRRQEGPKGAVHRVVHPGLGHGPEEVVGMDEAHGVSGTDGGVAQGLGQEALADAGGSQQQDCSCLSRNSREKTASSSRQSSVIDADQSKSSSRQVSSKRRSAVVAAEPAPSGTVPLHSGSGPRCCWDRTAGGTSP